MRILIFGNYAGGKVFYDELIQWLGNRGVEVDMLDWGAYQIYHNNFSSSTDIKPRHRLLLVLTKIKFVRKFAKILLIKMTLEAISKPYDIINVHFGNSANVPYLELFKAKGKKLVVTIWGSDYDRLPDAARNAAKPLYNQADVINFSNPDMRDAFTSYFNDYHSKVHIAGFGISKLEEIIRLQKSESLNDTKKQLGIPQNSFVITCGYKAFHVLQHLSMVEAIHKVREHLPNNYVLVFPLSYHRNEKYVKSLKLELEKKGLRYISFDKYLNDTDISRIRIASDIYMTIPVSDAVSASLLEHLTAKNVVLAGDWLPYEFLRNFGLQFHSVSLENLAETLSEVLQNYPRHQEKTERNPEIALRNFSWQQKVLEWERLYESALQD